MKKAVLALAVFAASTVTAQADTTPTIAASPPNRSVAGQTVTFTANFTYGCADGVAEQYFLIDGRQIPSTTFSTHDPNATATLVISSLAVGSHTISYHWETLSGVPNTRCGGDNSIPYAVKPKPAPPPPPARPSQVPSPAASPSSGPSAASPSRESAAPSAPAAQLTAHATPAGFPMPAGLPVLAAVAVVATIAFLLRRR